MTEDIVIIGKITSVFGVKGGLKIFSYTKPRLNILNYKNWLLDVDGQWQSVKLTSGRQQGKTIGVNLEGVNDRNQAEALVGRKIAVTSDQLPTLDDDTFYWRDLEGMRVINTEKIDFGVVSHLIETGSNDVLVVRETAEQAAGKDRKERMIPFLADAVLDVDTENKVIHVEWDADF